MMTVSEHIYQDHYYDYIDRGSVRSARHVIPMMQGLYEINSVLDVGCGRGAWLGTWLSLGVEDVVGIDGDYVERDKLPFPPGRFVAQDLINGFELQRTFDLVQCLEVAEHLPEACAERLVECLTHHGDVVLFSAASPGQGGENHINEKPLSYWVERFHARGFEPIDLLRPRLRTIQTVEPWYRNNMIVFARANHRLHAAADAPRWQTFRAPMTWRLRNALLATLPTTTVTQLARLKHAFSRRWHSSA